MVRFFFSVLVGICIFLAPTSSYAAFEWNGSFFESFLGKFIGEDSARITEADVRYRKVTSDTLETSQSTGSFIGDGRYIRRATGYFCEKFGIEHCSTTGNREVLIDKDGDGYGVLYEVSEFMARMYDNVNSPLEGDCNDDVSGDPEGCPFDIEDCNIGDFDECAICQYPGASNSEYACAGGTLSSCSSDYGNPCEVSGYPAECYGNGIDCSGQCVSGDSYGEGHVASVVDNGQIVCRASGDAFTPRLECESDYVSNAAGDGCELRPCNGSDFASCPSECGYGGGLAQKIGTCVGTSTCPSTEACTSVGYDCPARFIEGMFNGCNLPQAYEGDTQICVDNDGSGLSWSDDYVCSSGVWTHEDDVVFGISSDEKCGELFGEDSGNMCTSSYYPDGTMVIDEHWSVSELASHCRDVCASGDSTHTNLYRSGNDADCFDGGGMGYITTYYCD